MQNQIIQGLQDHKEYLVVPELDLLLTGSFEPLAM